MMPTKKGNKKKEKKKEKNHHLQIIHLFLSGTPTKSNVTW